jgi:hypothetical protein
MAKAKTTATAGPRIKKSSKKRPGVHATSKASKLKQSKNYKKKYKGQGR